MAKPFGAMLSHLTGLIPAVELGTVTVQQFLQFIVRDVPQSIDSIACNGSFLVLEKSFPGTFTHVSKFAAVLFIARNNAARIRSKYDFLFTRKASLKNVVIFKAKPSIFTDLSSGFHKKYHFYMSPSAPK